MSIDGQTNFGDELPELPDNEIFDPTKAEPTIEDRINNMYVLREELRSLESKAKEIKAEYKSEEERVITLMTEDGMRQVGTDNASATLSTEEMPTADPAEWMDIFKTIFESGYHELFRKQINAGPWRELRALGVDIPHVTSFTNTKLSLRARRS